VTLRDAHQVNNASSSKPGGAIIISELLVKSGELVQVHGPHEEASQQQQQQQPQQQPSKQAPGSAWKTDVDISGRSQAKERVLQAWQPDSNDEGFSLEESTPSRGLHSANAGGKWDQFAANEQLFGVKSQWDEDVYTHKLDTSRPDFAKRQAEAAKIAREIEGAASSNPHVLEERNLTVDDSGMTEEDKYSGVARAPNRWIPPAQRAAAQASNSGQPVDPAIISSQLARSSGAVSGPSRATGSNGKEDPIEAKLMRTFQDFVGKEESRIQQKKAQSFKKEKDGRLQDLLKFSQSFKLTTPVPEDLIPILTKDKSKQDAIVQKSASNSSAASSPVSARPAVNLGRQEAKPETLRAKIDKMRASPGGQQMPSPIRERSPADKLDSPAAKPAAPAPKAATSKLKATSFAFKPSAASFTPSFAPRGPMGSATSPALSNSSSMPPRFPPNHVDPSVFLQGKQPRPLAERKKILDNYNPFKTYKEKNPDSTLDIEEPHRTDPAWPHEKDARGLLDAPTYTFGKPYANGMGAYDEFGMPIGMAMPMHAQAGMAPYGAPFMQPMMMPGPGGMPPQFMSQPIYAATPQAMAAAAAAAAAAGVPFQAMQSGYPMQGYPPLPVQGGQSQQPGGGGKHSSNASFQGSPQQPSGFSYGNAPPMQFGSTGGQSAQQGGNVGNNGGGGKHGQAFYGGSGQQSIPGPGGYNGPGITPGPGAMSGYPGLPQPMHPHQQGQQQQRPGGQQGGRFDQRGGPPKGYSGHGQQRSQAAPNIPQAQQPQSQPAAAAKKETITEGKS
jgi:PAB1-binding protein PBP1